MSFRFVHAADFHLDSQFVGISQVCPEARVFLSEATFRAFDNVIDLCVGEQVDFLLVAGDSYEGPDITLRAQLHFQRGMMRLQQAGVQAYVIRGNHDPLNANLAHLDWPPNVHFFGPKVTSEVYSKDGEPQAIIHGVSFKRAKTEEDLALNFRRLDSPLFQIGLLHCSVGSYKEHEPYAPCTVDELTRGADELKGAGLDYWALGHIHKRQVLRESGPRIAYSGNTQGRHVNEAGPRGCFLVTVRGMEVSAEFVPTDVVRWGVETVSIASLESEQALLRASSEALSSKSAESEGRPTVVRVVLEGMGPLHDRLQDEKFVTDYEEELRRMGSELSPPVWIESVVQRTRPGIDVDERMKAEDVLADCLRIIADAREGKLSNDEIVQWLGDLLGHHQVRKYVDVPGQLELMEMLEASQSILLEELVEDSE